MSLPDNHRWISPSECASLLDATQHGEAWRARCPAHAGDNASALSIREGRDSYGNPMTLLHCHAHQCTIQDICVALGIEVRELFCIHPDYARSTRNLPRAKSPRIARLRQSTRPYTADEIAQLLLEEMIVSDPAWIQTCEGARAKMWELAAASGQAREAFTRALRLATLPTLQFWDRLAAEQGKG